MNPTTNYILSKNPTKRSFILNADVAALPSLLPKLAKKGYRNLYGFGKDQSVYEMSLYTQIKYEVNDKRNCHFPDSFFDIIIDASGDTDKAQKDEYYRLLASGGILIFKKGKKMNIYKSKKKSKFKLPKEINIVVSTKGIPEGIRYTTDI